MKKIPVKINSEILWVEERSIVRFQAIGNKTKVFLKNKKKILSTETLKHYENMLHGKAFFRISDYDMVNKRYVEKFCYKTRAVTLSFRTILLASFRRRKGFREYMKK